MFTNPITQKFYQAGEILKLPRLGKTLRTIANDEDAFYKGKLAQTLLKELQDMGSIITEEDLANYE